MIPRPGLNIWRVYMDLFSNFMGLVLLGGAGMMLMVGGAIMHTQVGASVFDAACRHGEALQSDPALSDFLKGASSDVDHCTTAGKYDDIRFARDEPQGDAVQEIRVKAGACRHIYSLVNFLETTKTPGAGIEVVGRASEDYEHPGRECMAAPAGDASPVRQWTCLNCTAEEREQGAALLISPRFQVVGSTAPANRYMCNASLAAQRATWVYKVCLSDAAIAANDRPTQAAFMRHVTIAAEPAIQQCDTAADPDCDRTVLVRMRLPHNAPPWRTTALAAANGRK